MSGGQQKTTHVHYHYHYYDPAHHTARPPNSKMTKSQLLPAREYSTQEGETDPHGALHVEEGRAMGERERSFKKLKISNCWSTENCSREAEKQQKQTQAPDISSFTAQEEQLSLYEQGSPFPSHHFNRVFPPFQAKNLGDVQRGIIAGYESELVWYKKEVARLRLIEEECIYLRNSYMKHYQSCQRKNN